MKQLKKLFLSSILFFLILPSAKASAADYTVASNDTLYSLSQLFNTSVSFIKSSNNLDRNNLTPGDVIYVPAHVHTVKSGETLYRIARSYEIPLADLKRANNYDSSVEPGDKLIIPGVRGLRSADTVIPYENGEITLLAKLIEAEAGGETLQAKIGVGAVVVNRVQSGVWASSIRGVIYQKTGEYYQFTPVKNGYINNKPSADSIRAAWTAMYGSDPSKGAQYYFDNTSKNEWLWAKPKTAYLDSLIFAK
jgi:spore germination cell wall hydrolase CwlJ-like protein